MAATIPIPNDCCDCNNTPSLVPLDEYIQDAVDDLVTGQLVVIKAYTLNEIRALTSHSNKDLVHYTDDSAFNAHYKYNSSSVAADDSFSVLKPDNVGAGDPGRWIRDPTN